MTDRAITIRLAEIETRITPRIQNRDIENVRRDALWLIKIVRAMREAHAPT